MITRLVSKQCQSMASATASARGHQLMSPALRLPSNFPVVSFSTTAASLTGRKKPPSHLQHHREHQPAGSLAWQHYHARSTYKRPAFYKRRAFWIALGVFGAGFGVVYALNREQVPISGRMRFIATNPELEADLFKDAHEPYLEQFKGHILDDSHPSVKRVKRVAERIIAAAIELDALHNPPPTASSNGSNGSNGNEDNGDNKEKNVDCTAARDVNVRDWEFFVIDLPINNAFVLPNNKVFVFKGIIDLCGDDGDDMLAAIIGHEVAHRFARHGPEKISWLLAFYPLQIILSLFVDPTLLAFNPLLYQLALMLPNSRTAESEADYIGLQYLVRACYKPNAAPELWRRFTDMEREEAATAAAVKINDRNSRGNSAAESNSTNGGAMAYLLRTHPPSEQRMVDLENAIPEALVAHGKLCSHTQAGSLREALEIFIKKAFGSK